MSSSLDLSAGGDDANMDIYADQRGRIIGSCVAIFIITDIFVLLRLVSRKLARAGYWWDDVFALIAMLLSNVLCIIWFCELKNGYGRHIYIWPPGERLEKEKHWRRGFFVFELFFHTAITICKFSVLAFYFRIFPYRGFRNILLVMAALSLAYGISVDITILFQCRPLHYQWDISDPNEKGQCVNFHAFFIGKGIANVILNVLIFALPIPLLWRLRVTFRQQVILASLFTLAGFVIVVSIVWIVVVPDVTQPDITWGSVNFGIWSTLEPNIAVICACIPSLRPLWTILTRNGVFQHPMIRKSVTKSKNLMSSTVSQRSATLNNIIHSHKLKFGSSNKSAGSTSTNDSELDGRFSRLDEAEDGTMGSGTTTRPLGHEVKVGTGGNWDPVSATEMPGRQQHHRPHQGHHGHGRDTAAETTGEMEVPMKGIGVTTDVDVVVESGPRLPYNDRLY